MIAWEENQGGENQIKSENTALIWTQTPNNGCTQGVGQATIAHRELRLGDGRRPKYSEP